MKLNKYILNLTVLIILLATACELNKTNSKDIIDVNIKLSNATNNYLSIYRIEPKSSILMDSALATETKINFKISPYQSPDIYLLRISSNKSLMFIAKKGQSINIELNPNTSPLQYNIYNSFSSNLIKENNNIINTAVKEFDSIYSNYRSSETNLNTLRIKTDSSLKAIQEHLYFNLKRNIKSHPSDLSSIIGLYSRFANSFIFNLKADSSLFYLISDSCYAKYPNNKHSITLKNTINISKENSTNIDIKEHLLDKGNVFKDLCMLRSDENKYCIYDNTAKYKIIYIWRSKDKAFWDYNPILKKIYNKYNRKTLDIIGISAERDKLNWLNYCTMERLNWINLIARPSQLNDINPKGIFPRIYVLNKDFEIIAKDPNINDIEKIIKI